MVHPADVPVDEAVPSHGESGPYPVGTTPTAPAAPAVELDPAPAGTTPTAPAVEPDPAPVGTTSAAAAASPASAADGAAASGSVVYHPSRHPSRLITPGPNAASSGQQHSSHPKSVSEITGNQSPAPLFFPSTLIVGDSIIRNIRFANAVGCFPGAATNTNTDAKQL